MKNVTLTANRFDRNRRPIQVPLRAHISTSISPKVLSEVKSWRRSLKQHGEEDSSWDWAETVRKFEALQRGGLEEYEYAVLRCEGRTQALMAMETANHLSPRTDKPPVYVEYLSVAPRNRPGIRDPRRFNGCGSVLIHHALERSESLGYRGRVGLHSLPGARVFYLRIGFKDFGPDPRDFLQRWCRRAEASCIPILVKFAHLLAGYRSAILAWYDFPISNGPLEGTNNKIKTMQRMAYGYRDHEFFMLKIYALHECKYALVG